MFRSLEPPLAFTEGFEAPREYLADVYSIVNVNTIHCTGMGRGRRRRRESEPRSLEVRHGSVMPSRVELDQGLQEGYCLVGFPCIERSDRRAKEHHHRVVGRSRDFCEVRRCRIRQLAHRTPVPGRRYLTFSVEISMSVIAFDRERSGTPQGID